VLLAHSDKPLRLLIKLGAGVTAGALLVAVWLVRHVLLGQQAPLLTAILISIWLLGGVGLAALGIVGLYVSKAFEASKARPLYIVHIETAPTIETIS
jgi:dolichol-phosphate mannosyltransferase